MRLIGVDKLQEGMVVAKTIFRADGSVVINKDAVVKNSFINKLYNMGISEVFIRTEGTENIELEDIVLEDTRNKVNIVMKETMSHIALSEEMDIEYIKELVTKILDEIWDIDIIAKNFIDIKSADDYTVVHCINVGILALITGISLGYNEKQLKILGIGAILHDIGKAKIDESILNKPTKLSNDEFAIMKNHTVKGYEILKRIPNISAEICNIALFHHERVDGTGYPYEVRGDAIPEMAKIVSVVDVFDALTSDRAYRSKMEIYMVVDYLQSLKRIQFDSKVVDAFCSNIALYPSGKRVKLNDGQKGFIVVTSRKNLSKPMVMITHGYDSIKKATPYLLNLMEYEDIYVEDVL